MQDFLRGLVWDGTPRLDALFADYLQDTTGNRRFWPVNVGEHLLNVCIDFVIKRLLRERVKATGREIDAPEHSPRDEIQGVRILQGGGPV